jgi:hypothetical protein
LEKAGLAPAFFFALLWRPAERVDTGFDLGGPSHGRKTVDGMQQALEISARSSYVLTLSDGVRSRFFRKTCVKHGAVTCPEIATWMK